MKTIEQAAEEYADSLKLDDAHRVSKQQFKEYAQSDFKAGFEFAQRWIPVEEELPVFDKTEYPTGNYKTFFVKILTGGMNPIIRYGTAHLVNDKRWSCEFDWNIVTHYRPIEYK